MQTGKKKYAKPQLKVHGTVEQLTKGDYIWGTGDSFPDAEGELANSAN